MAAALPRGSENEVSAGMGTRAGDGGWMGDAGTGCGASSWLDPQGWGGLGCRAGGAGSPREGDQGMGCCHSLTALSFLSRSNPTRSWERPALQGTQDPQAPLGCLASLDPQATQAMKGPQGSLGGMGSWGPLALQGLWDHPVSPGLKELQGLQAQQGQMDPRGHQDSQDHKAPPGYLGTKDPLVPLDPHHSLANPGSEGSQDSLD